MVYKSQKCTLNLHIICAGPEINNSNTVTLVLTLRSVRDVPTSHRVDTLLVGCRASMM